MQRSVVSAWLSLKNEIKVVFVDPVKINVMQEWHCPKDPKGLCGFLGLTGYYRRFVQGYSLIAKPLIQMLKKDWSSEEALEAYETLKQKRDELRLLTTPNFNLPFEIETDATGIGLGAVLMQQGKPLAFFSQALADRSRLKPVYERELSRKYKMKALLVGEPFHHTDWP
jgi:hypothetical protein